MSWVLLFVGIALAGVAVLVALAVWLWRKTVALAAEVAQVAGQGGELMDLLAQVEVPSLQLDELDDPAPRRRGSDDDWSLSGRT